MSKRLGEERVGEERTTLEGERVRIVCYFTSMDIRVEFEDGTQVKTTYLNFRRGDIRYPLKMKRLKEHGRAKDGSATRIIAYRCSTDIDVLFENGEILEHTTYPKFRNGTVQQPSRQRRDRRPSTGRGKRKICRTESGSKSPLTGTIMIWMSPRKRELSLCMSATKISKKASLPKNAPEGITRTGQENEGP